MPCWCRLAVVVLLLSGSLRSAQALDADRPFHQYVKGVWSIDQGLPQISVMAITQDHNGYLWVGTQAGLARFDGVRFVNFNPADTPALPGAYVQALHTDRAGRMWIGTYKGLARYFDRDFSAIPLADANAAALDVRDIEELPDGRIVAAGPTGTFLVENDRLVPFPGAPRGAALALLADADALWIGGEGGAHRVAADGVRFVPTVEGEAPVTVLHLAQADGVIWAATNHGAWRLRAGAFQLFTADALEPTQVEALRADRGGNLWIAYTGSLVRVRDGVFVERIDDASPAAHRAVKSIFEDREGNLWLGSQWEGLARLWNGWTRRHSIDEGLHDPIVWSLTRDPDGSVWVGSNDGLSRYRDGRFEQVLQGAQLPHPNAYTLLAEAGALWIGTRRGLAVWRDGELQRAAQFASLRNSQINGLLRRRDGALWLATSSGLYRERDGELLRYGPAEGLQDPRVRVLHETGDGRLLLGTQDGLYEVDGARVRRVGVDAGLPAHHDVTAIHELPGGQLLVGTLSERLFQFDGTRWFEFTSRHGLPVNTPFFITHDSRGWLWVGGIRGIYRVPLADLDAVRSGRRHVVENAQMLLSERGDQRGSQKGYCCNGAGNAKGFIDNDTLWLPSRGGVVTLNSRDVSMNPVLPGVTIERVRFAGDWHEVEPDRPLTLPLGARDLAFEFTALSFQQPESIGLRYRLSGYDREWQHLSDVTRRNAIYTNLPPGPYVFEVAGANNALKWNPQPARLRFEIAPRFHETSLFYVVIAIALVAVGLALHALKTRQLRRRHQALETLVAERTHDLAAANERLQEMSQTDALTGLRNRRFLHTQLPADLAFYLREMRKPGNEGSVMMLALADIDHFKTINDRYGHRAGDLVLQQFAAVLARLVRSGDYVVRWGGEEFLLVFRPMPWKEAARVAERIRRSVAEHEFDVGSGEPLHLTVSLGFIEYPLFRDAGPTPDWQGMVELADRALYTVKSTGRNGWATYRPTAPMSLDEVLAELDDSAKTGTPARRVDLARSPPA